MAAPAPQREPQQKTYGRWLPAMAAACALGLVFVLGMRAETWRMRHEQTRWRDVRESADFYAAWSTGYTAGWLDCRNDKPYRPNKLQETPQTKAGATPGGKEGH